MEILTIYYPHIRASIASSSDIIYSMAIFYPRKQTVIIFVVCILAVGAVSYYTSSSTDEQKNGHLVDTVKVAPIISNDLLNTTTDWKKQFIEKAPDTAYKTAKNSPTNQPPLTVTDKLGRDFFQKYMELHKAGLTTDSQSVNDASLQLIKDSVTNIAFPTDYSYKNISVIPDNGTANASIYAKRLLQIMGAYMPTVNETDIVTEALDKDDMSLLKKIDPIIANYKAARTALLATPVPESLANDHLNLINALNLQVFNAQSLRKTDTDPVTALAAVNQEITSLQNISVTLGRMQNYFTVSGISFITRGIDPLNK